MPQRVESSLPSISGHSYLRLRLVYEEVRSVGPEPDDRVGRALRRVRGDENPARTAGEYQINVQVPNAADGDQPIATNITNINAPENRVRARFRQPWESLADPALSAFVA
jgi:hypothetical protein